jgi:hypothetical protein
MAKASVINIVCSWFSQESVVGAMWVVYMKSGTNLLSLLNKLEAISAQMA